MMKRGTLLFVACLLFPLFGSAQADNFPWQSFTETETQKSNSDRQIIPETYRTVSLNGEEMTNILKSAPLKHSAEAETEDVRLVLPMPDGSNEEFKIVYAPIMAPGLAAEYPEIQSFAGQGIDDPTAYVRFGVTQNGFHAMILSARHSTVFINAYAKNNTEDYISYYKNDYAKRADDNFECLTEGQTEQEAAEAQTAVSAMFKAGGDCQLRTYRLALACTQEYANFHGGDVPDVLAEYNVLLTRVNGIYERDFAVDMILVDNTDTLIFTSEPDPYTNSSPEDLLVENQITCDSLIGSANYDIGHVLGTAGGGLAGLGVPCDNGAKAVGMTGLSSPVNDVFYVDYVAHEIGHQFGANHTFNNDCFGNRNSNTAVEPGSGSTIMGYAGICSPNVQNNSDDYFHAISLSEVYEYIINDTGSTCPQVTNNPNNPPVIAMEETSFIAPVGTPFLLTANATDPDDDILTYCWEQMDNEISEQAPLPTNNAGPNFRSLSPTENPTRYFPSLDNILNNTNDPWEVLSSVSRSMSFRCLVRDNNMGEGCTDEIDVNIGFTDEAGPFLVLSPNTNVTWQIGDEENVTWDVADTDQAPVSCANVDIKLSTDGGNTYPITLAEGVPNSGSAMVAVPNNLTTIARVMVFCSDNIFFDVSDQNFTIEEPSQPTFLVNASPVDLSICNTETASFDLDFTALAGFNESITLSASGIPNGASAIFSVNPIAGQGNSTLTISNLTDIAAGEYTITIDANSPSVNNSVQVQLSLAAGIPQVTDLISPTTNATGVSPFATLNWSSVSGATAYNVIVSTSPDFAPSSVVYSGDVSSSTALTSQLDFSTVYYWQVNATTACGTGGYSDFGSFQTGESNCETYTSTDVPIQIPDDVIGDYSSTITISEDIVFSDVDVNVFIRHTWVGDLSATLTSPEGTTVSLFNQPGFPEINFGCSGDDINVTLDDDADNSAEDLEDTCEGTIPTVSGTFQPVSPLAVFNGESAQGPWTLNFSDVYDEDGGQLDSWSIFACSSGNTAPPAVTVTINDLNVAQGASETVTDNELQAFASGSSGLQLTYTVLSLPSNGTLSLNGNALNVGDTFTQADIDAGFLSYMHDGSATNSDGFDFSVLSNQNAWFPDGTLNINIIQNNLSATAAVQQEILCNGDSNGSITVSASGGGDPLSYSIDGQNFQPGNTFTGLEAGNYTITVRDNFGFEVSTNSVTLNDPPVIVVSNVVDGSTITVDATGGTSPFTFSIDGTNYQASNVFSNLSNGTYNVCVRDANNCETCKEETIAVNNVVVTASITNQISCFNENDGVITVNAVGGSEPYTYTLNDGTPQDSNVFDFLPSGIYTITAMDNDGFSATTTVITLDNPAQIISNLSVDGDMITVFASGGTGALTYSVDGSNYQSSNVFDNLDNGSYDVCTRDANDCEVCLAAVIAVDMMVVNAELSNDITCNDDNNGTITVNAAGGMPPYTYSINGGAPQDSNVFSGLSAGNYSVEVTDSDDNTLLTNTITITNPDAVSVSANVNESTITASAGGGTGVLLYSLNGGTYQSSGTFTNLNNGTYQICARDENNCEECTSATVAVNNISVAVVLTQAVSCFGEDDGEISVNATGGNDPYEYRLNGEDPAQASNVFSGLSAGEYFVEVTDNDGFVSNSQSITLTEPDELVVEASVDDFTVTITAEGGTGSYEYSSNGVDFTNSNIFVLDENGSYTFYVEDENGCVASVVATVGVNTIFATLNLQNGITCAGDSDACIAVSVTGATPPVQFELNGTVQENNGIFCGLGGGTYSVNITDADGFQFTTDALMVTEPEEILLDYTVLCDEISAEASGGLGALTFTLNGTEIDAETTAPNGEYELAVQDINGCTVSETIVINNVTDADISSIDIPCFGDATGSISVSNVQGGSPEYAYSINGLDFQDNPEFTGLSAATYEIIVQDAVGCFISQEVNINEADELNITATSGSSTLFVTAEGGTPGYQYSVDGQNFQDSNIFEGLPAGEYTVTVEDANGCTATTVTEILSSLDDPDFGLDFAVNPNPNPGIFNILINTPTERDLIVRVFDVAGKEIFRNVYMKNNEFFSQNIHLENAASGSYFVTIHDGKITGTKEVLVIQ